MKKKGLIISTVVMVVVLIAALTTTTFAWFSTTALAEVQNINVQAATSQGLQIAFYDPQTTSKTYTSGEGSLKTGTGTLESHQIWAGAEGSTWGDALSFSSEAKAEYMGVSGDGLTSNMFKLANKEGAGLDGAVAGTEKIEAAIENTDYFVAYIALTNTKDEDAGSKVNLTLNITPGATTGMLAAMRIAIFASKDEGDATTAITFATADATFVYDPYYELVYKTNTKKWATTGAADTNYLTKKSEGDSSGTYGGDYEAKTALSTTYSGKFVKGAASNGDETTGPKTVTLEDQQVFESLAAEEIVYLRVVIWFEGEDKECLTAFAGSSATISMQFSLAKGA